MEAPTPIRDLRPGLPEPLAAAIMRCLEKPAADRWQSAEDLLTHLELIAATPSGGMTPTDTRPLRGIGAVMARKRRTRLVGAALTTLALLGGSAAAWHWTRGGGAAAGIQRIGVMPIDDISGRDSVFVLSLIHI